MSPLPNSSICRLYLTVACCFYLTVLYVVLTWQFSMSFWPKSSIYRFDLKALSFWPDSSLCRFDLTALYVVLTLNFYMSFDLKVLYVVWPESSICRFYLVLFVVFTLQFSSSLLPNSSMSLLPKSFLCSFYLWLLYDALVWQFSLLPSSFYVSFT